jgi:hypothetical protein
VSRSFFRCSESYSRLSSLLPSTLFDPRQVVFRFGFFTSPSTNYQLKVLFLFNLFWFFYAGIVSHTKPIFPYDGGGHHTHLRGTRATYGIQPLWTPESGAVTQFLVWNGGKHNPTSLGVLIECYLPFSSNIYNITYLFFFFNLFILISGALFTWWDEGLDEIWSELRPWIPERKASYILQFT